jgi:TrmH family RNA methyltransferase
MTKITSLQNAKIKSVIRLRDGRGRRRQGRMLIDGVREIRRAWEAGVAIVEVYFCAETCNRSSDAELLVDQLAGSGLVMFEVARTVLEKLTFGERSEGLVAVAVPPDSALDRLVLPSEGLVAVLEGIEKPGNVGAVLRSADAAGVAAVIVADEGTDLFNPNAIRASLGAIFTVPVAAASSREVLDWLRYQDFTIYAAWLDGTEDYSHVTYRGRSAVILGSEAHGLSDLWRSEGITRVRLPMRGLVDSLNVSAAAAVLFYEALRQKSWGNCRTKKHEQRLTSG